MLENYIYRLEIVLVLVKSVGVKMLKCICGFYPYSDLRGLAPNKKILPESHSGRPTGAGSKVRGESLPKDIGITQVRDNS